MPGLLESVPDDLRDMDINGHFIETDSGIVEIISY